MNDGSVALIQCSERPALPMPARPPLALSLADWLQPAVPHDSAVPASIVAQLL